MRVGVGRSFLVVAIGVALLTAGYGVLIFGSSASSLDSVLANDQEVAVFRTSFEEQAHGWSFFANGSSKFSIVSGAGVANSRAARVKIGNLSSNIQLFRTPVVLSPGLMYRLKFSARSELGSVFEVYAHKHGSPYSNYGLAGQRIETTNAWRSFSVDFRANNLASSDARIRLWFVTSMAGDNIYLDDVVLLRLGTTGVTSPHPTSSAASTVTPSPSVLPSLNPTVSPHTSPVGSAHHSHVPVSGAFRIVDPVHWTDSYVNRFIKDQVRAGERKTVGGGVWWGPVDRFFDNQLWIINRSVITGRRFARNESPAQNVACLLPGKTSQNLPGRRPRNELNLDRAQALRVGVPNISERRYSLTHGELGVFRTISSTLRYARDVESRRAVGDNAGPAGYTYFTACHAEEGFANQFGDGTPRLGDRINAQVRQIVWVDRDPSENGDGYWNFQRAPVSSTPLLSRAWYEDLEYVAGGIDGGVSDNLGRFEAYDLVGAEVRGMLRVNGLAQRIIINNASRSSRLHHLELRIDESNKDYTVDMVLYDPDTDSPLGYTAGRVMSLDTRVVSDGWHILSLHYHIIDRQNPAPRRGKQLAGELKIPICVNNSGRADCR